MTVHASSVISTDINTFDSTLYDKITDMENNQYTVGTNGGITEYTPLFQELSDKIVAWMNVNRESTIREFIQNLYSYKQMSDVHGSSSTLLVTSDSRNIFTMGGFRDDVKVASTTYYDGYPTISFSGADITRSSGSWVNDGFSDTMSITVIGSGAGNDGTYAVSGAPTGTTLTTDGSFTTENNKQNVRVNGTGLVKIYPANMLTDINLIANAVSAQETPDIDTLKSGMVTTISNKIFDLLFVSGTPNPASSAEEMATYVFTTLNYKEVFDNLNVGSLTSPI